MDWSFGDNFQVEISKTGLGNNRFAYSLKVKLYCKCAKKIIRTNVSKAKNKFQTWIILSRLEVVVCVFLIKNFYLF